MQFIINSHGGIVSVGHDVDECDMLIENADVPDTDKRIIKNADSSEQYITGQFDDYTLQHFVTEDINLFVTQWFKKTHKLTVQMISAPLKTKHEFDGNDVTTLVAQMRDAVNEHRDTILNDHPLYLNSVEHARTVFDNLIYLLTLMNTKNNCGGKRIEDNDDEIVTLSVYVD